MSSLKEVNLPTSIVHQIPDIPADVLALPANPHGLGFMVAGQLKFIVTGSDGRRYERALDGRVIPLTRYVQESDADYED